jgi:hypothetical protein
VSSYALFQWWLLLSQHPGCHCALTPFHTELGFGDLSCRSGLFPFRRRSLAPAVSLTASMLVAFAVGLGLVTSTWPLAHAALYLHDTSAMAVPQYISGRTSYLHVRLEFLLYPQLLPQFCNTGGCEPRLPATVASLWSWIAHVVSGRIAATLASFRLGCPRTPQL